MTDKTLSRAIVYSLGAHGLALAMIIAANSGAALPRQPLETVPFIKASLVYAMAGKGDAPATSSMHEKMKQETNHPVTHLPNRKAEPALAMTEATKAKPADRIHQDSSTVLHLPDLQISGAGVVASRGKSSGKDHDGGGQRESARTSEKTSALPRYLSTSRPAYPMVARLRGYEGVVTISVEVLPDGRAGQVRINRTSGHASLDKSALEAVKGWRFEPAKKSGQAIPMWVEVPVRFSLNDDA